MDGIDLSEAIEAATAAGRPWYADADLRTKEEYRKDMAIAISAAAPLIEAQVRIQITGDIEALLDNTEGDDIVLEAARIARGHS